MATRTRRGCRGPGRRTGLLSMSKAGQRGTRLRPWKKHILRPEDKLVPPGMGEQEPGRGQRGQRTERNARCGALSKRGPGGPRRRLPWLPRGPHHLAREVLDSHSRGCSSPGKKVRVWPHGEPRRLSSPPAVRRAEGMLAGGGWGVGVGPGGVCRGPEVFWEEGAALAPSLPTPAL